MFPDEDGNSAWLQRLRCCAEPVCLHFGDMDRISESPPSKPRRYGYLDSRKHLTEMAGTCMHPPATLPRGCERQP